jgi:Beta-galactosidase
MNRSLLLCLVTLMALPLVGAEPDVWERPVEFGLVTGLSLRHSGTELGNSVKPTSDDRTHYFEAFQELGITTVRDAIINWAEVQPEREGPYDFGYLDDLVRKASEHGIEVLGLAYFFPPWATVGEDRPWNYPNDGRYKLPMRKYEGDFRKFVRASVGRYCGCRPGSLSLRRPVRQFVFMNETEGYAHEFLSPDEYAHWLRVFSEEVRAVDPRIKIVAPALAAPGGWHRNYHQGEFLERLLDSKELIGPGWPYFDIVDYHPYPSAYGSAQPDLFAIDAATSYVRETLARHKLRMPLWITEIGDNSSDEATQADRVVEYAIHAASVGVDRVYIFGMADYGKDHWGLLGDTPSGQPPVHKASFVAYKTLLSKISDNRRIDFLGPGRYVVFRKNRPPVYVLWASGESTAPYFLHGSLLVTDLTGHTETTDTEHLKLSKDPVLIEPQNQTVHQ